MACPIELCSKNTQALTLQNVLHPESCVWFNLTRCWIKLDVVLSTGRQSVIQSMIYAASYSVMMRLGTSSVLVLTRLGTPSVLAITFSPGNEMLEAWNNDNMLLIRLSSSSSSWSRVELQNLCNSPKHLFMKAKQGIKNHFLLPKEVGKDNLKCKWLIKIYII